LSVVLSVLNKKGGVGKTTIAVNLAQGLAIIGKKVLVIDNDEQHNISAILGLSVAQCKATLADVYAAPRQKLENIAAQSIYCTFLENLDCVPGSRGLEQIHPRAMALREFLATKAVAGVGYDFVIIDNCPGMAEKPRCAIAASDYFLIPVHLRQSSINGLYEMFNVLAQELKIPSEKIYILRNMYRDMGGRNRSFSSALEVSYPDNLTKTIISDDEAFESVAYKTKSVFFSKTSSRGTLQFIDLISELFGYKKEVLLDKFLQAIKDYKADLGREQYRRMQIISSSLNEEGVENGDK
jgi:chromosome partitioning protein